ncbi:MAG: cyclic nucleotide-binding domain-containing protein [Kiritimatiellae bacterium]|nr:cyclic nucleotide-binding domain-containing protein [Kiritimatiellia bacterium]MDD5521236.1 cyclic nucleotide-binding domain-containing protein [Kiritimatiellia bacterium]
MGILDKLFKSKVSVETPMPDKTALIGKIRQSDLFKNLPAKNLEEMFARMETVKVKSGETIIEQGGEGDYYYLLVTGMAQVFKQANNEDQPKVVAELNEPVGFGEEALISNAKRNATIKMQTDGVVMRLSKDAFDDYVKEPMVVWLSPMDAQDKIAKGAKWIDVRDPDEAKQGRLHGALFIPLNDIRTRMSELDKSIQYICYCINGRQSSTAVFLLRQHGYNVGVLRGGLQALKR